MTSTRPAPWWTLVAVALLVACVLLAGPAALWAATLGLSLALLVGYLHSRSAVDRGPILLAAAVALLLGVGLLVPGAIGLAVSGGKLLSLVGGSGSARSAALTWLALCAAGVWVAQRPPRGLSDRAFFVAVLTLVTLGRFALLATVSVQPVSDFATMWSLAGKAVATPIAQIPLTKIHSGIYLQRVLPYFLPLRALFGDTRFAYGVANCLLTGVSSLVISQLAGRWYGARASRFALVLSSLAVEPLIAVGIPTHDIPGTGLALLALLVLDNHLQRLDASFGWRWALAAVSFGLVAYATEIQRSTGGFLLVGGLVGLALVPPRYGTLTATRRPLAGRLGWAGLALVTYSLAASVMQHQHLSITGAALRQHRGMGMAALSTSWNHGTWLERKTEIVNRYPDVALDWQRFVVVRLATETALDPLARVGNYIRKSGVLFGLGGQCPIYLEHAQAGGGEIGAAWLEAVEGANLIVVLLLLPAMIWGLWLALRAAENPRSLVPAIFLAIVSTLLILAGEVQSRYMFPLWTIGALYAGHGLARVLPRPAAEDTA